MPWSPLVLTTVESTAIVLLTFNTPPPVKPSPAVRVTPGPVGPVAPVKPVGPVGPVNPVGPVVPVDPVDPVGPVGPAGPVEPVLPVEPCTPLSPATPSAQLLYGPEAPLVKSTLIVTDVAPTDVIGPSTKIDEAFEALNLIPTIHPKFDALE